MPVFTEYRLPAAGQPASYGRISVEFRRRFSVRNQPDIVPFFGGWVGQWHFGKRLPSGADHEEQQPEPIGLDAA
ncbi:MAG: hypothetical protein WCC69_07290 [Pirellulales bacterium]